MERTIQETCLSASGFCSFPVVRSIAFSLVTVSLKGTIGSEICRSVEPNSCSKVVRKKMCTQAIGV